MVCEPEVKSVEETVAVQLALALARLSLTVTAPRAVGPMVVPGAPEPRLTLVGVVMVSAPFVTVNVVVVGPADSIAVISVRPDVAAEAGRAVVMTNMPPAAIRKSDLRMELSDKMSASGMSSRDEAFRSISGTRLRSSFTPFPLSVSPPL